MVTHSYHPYHLVNPSPWPLTGATGAMTTTLGMIKWFDQYDKLFMGLTLITSAMIQWWQDITREGTYQGLHTLPISKGFQWGMILFVVSEVFIFILWAFFSTEASRLESN